MATQINNPLKAITAPTIKATALALDILRRCKNRTAGFRPAAKKIEIMINKSA